MTLYVKYETSGDYYGPLEIRATSIFRLKKVCPHNCKIVGMSVSWKPGGPGCGHIPRALLYQKIETLWCASLWGILPECIWADGRALVTTITCYNLNFVGSAFEHRWNLTSHMENLELWTLAYQEKDTWGPNHHEFVPFKNAVKGGYGGVRGRFNFLVEGRVDNISVTDLNNSGHALIRMRDIPLIL